MFRAVNENMRALNETFEALTGTFTIACECYDAHCIKTIDVRAEDYLQVRAQPRQFVVLPAHVLPEVETVVRETERWVVVEKTETAGEVAEFLDPNTSADV
jgi:hypothetical protein